MDGLTTAGGRDRLNDVGLYTLFWSVYPAGGPPIRRLQNGPAPSQRLCTGPLGFRQPHAILLCPRSGVQPADEWRSGRPTWCKRGLTPAGLRVQAPVVRRYDLKPLRPGTGPGGGPPAWRPRRVGYPEKQTSGKKPVEKTPRGGPKADALTAPCYLRGLARHRKPLAARKRRSLHVVRPRRVAGHGKSLGSAIAWR